jgi:hypothetical protein
MLLNFSLIIFNELLLKVIDDEHNWVVSHCELFPNSIVDFILTFVHFLNSLLLLRVSLVH